MSGYSAPAVLAALPVKFTAAGQAADPALNGEVRDGPAPGDSSAVEVISIGFTGPDTDDSGSAEMTSGGLAGDRDREAYDVHCAISVSAGDPGIAPVRTRAFALLAACRAQLTGAPTLGGACMRARIGSWSMREDFTDGGVVVTLRFDVHVEAFTPR